MKTKKPREWWGVAWFDGAFISERTESGAKFIARHSGGKGKAIRVREVLPKRRTKKGKR